MRKTTFWTTVAIVLVAGVLAFGYAKPDTMRALFKSEELYNNARTTEAATPQTADATTEAAIAPAAGTTATTETPAATTPAPATADAATKPADAMAQMDKTVQDAYKTAPPPAAATDANETTPSAGDAAKPATPEVPDYMKSSETAPSVDSKVVAPSAAQAEEAKQPTLGIDIAEAMKDHEMGSPNAPLTVYDYSSLSCPHCAAFHNTMLPKVKQYYIDTGKVRWVFRTFPHNEQALRAEMLARCVPRDQYVKMVDMMFSNQERWAFSSSPIANLAMLVKVAGVDDQRFQACTTNKALEEAVLKIAQDGTEKYKIGSTPTFIFNDGAKKLEGAGSYETFAYELDYFLNDLADKAKSAQQSTAAPAGKL